MAESPYFKYTSYLREPLYIATGGFACAYAYMVNSDGDAMQSISVQQGENYFAIKATLAQSFLAVLGILMLLLSGSVFAVSAYTKDFSPLDYLQDHSFGKQFRLYVNVFRRHILTLIAVSAVFILFDRGNVKRFSTDDDMVGVAVATAIIAAAAKLFAELEARYSTGNDALLGDDEKKQSSKVSSYLVIAVAIAVFVFNEFNDNGLNDNSENEKGYESRAGMQGLIIAVGLIYLFGFLARRYLKECLPERVQEVLEMLPMLAMPALYALIVFGVWNVEAVSSETSIISLLGLLVLDVASTTYETKEESEPDYKGVINVGRWAHFFVGVAAFILLYVGMADEEGTLEGFGNLNTSNLTRINKEFNMTAQRIAAQNHTGINDHIELPAAPKIMRDIALVSAAVKIISVLYFWMEGSPRFSAEATLRQMSTIGLLLSSSFVWAYPLVNDTIDTAKDFNLELVIILAFFARIADMVQDTLVHSKGNNNWDKFIAYWENDDASDSSLESARNDNPRTWFVISALAITVGMLSRVIADDSTEILLDDKQTHWDGVLLSALILSIVHLLVALVALVPAGKKVSEQKPCSVRDATLSRSPVIRLLVTTTVLVLLGMLVSEMGFPGSEGEDQYGLFKAKGAQKDSKLQVTAIQWNALGALVSYVIADLVGHVFL